MHKFEISLFRYSVIPYSAFYKFPVATIQRVYDIDCDTGSLAEAQMELERNQETMFQ